MTSKGDGYSLKIEGGTRVKLKAGPFTFLIHSVSTVPLVPVKTRSEADKLIIASLLIALAVMVVVGLVIYHYPERDTDPILDNSQLTDSPVASYQKAKEEEKQQEEEEEEEIEEVVEEEIMEEVIVPVVSDSPKVTNPSPTAVIGEGPRVE